MKASVHPPFPVNRPARPRRGAFALVLTLLILSLLVVVAVSYLSSMVGERQTADAYTSKTRAEQMAQAGADSAMAILKETFRDFPDSATVWDTAQSTNADGTPNEGTSLYLRAMPDSNNYADPFPTGIPSASTSIAANDPGGNDPGNPKCKNFVLPLISGVPNGKAQLVSNKKNIFTAGMNYTVTDPTTQNSVDLNVRRGSGDIQGVIGSPPGWTGTAPNVGATPAPKPARAYWVNLKSNVKDASGNAPVTGRYAFWVEDESFRANSSYFGDPTLPGQGVRPPDNVTQPTATPSGSPRGLQPGDATLLGPLTLANDASASVDATTIFNTRKSYPGQFFPDPLAFAHTSSDGTSSFSTTQTDLLRYLLTNQSGTLNLTRHGTQRLNLNDVVPQPPATDPGSVTPVATLQTQVNQIVQTLKFHLPYLGERFYRTPVTPNTLTPSVLNSVTTVPGSPKTDAAAISNDNSEIYYYKVAANLIDYLDADTQPTIVDPGGTIHPTGKPVTALNGSGSATNEVWAIGKETAPYLQEAAIRARPVVSPVADATGAHPFNLKVDYYLEFWNMSDHDVYASPQTDKTLPNLHGATIRVTNQSIWELYPGPAYGAVPTNDGTYRLSDGGPETDYEIDLTTNVRLNGSGGSLVPGGVVFRAGTMTVITTDPDCASYVFYGPPGQTSVSTSATGIPTNPTTGKPYGSNPQNTYYCPNLLEGQRVYNGTIPKTSTGMEMKFRDANYSYDYETEVTLCNSYGILDSVPFAIDEHWYQQTKYTDSTGTSYPSTQDYSYSSCLMGNLYDANLHFTALASQLGDPRTNNEQLTIQPYVASGNGDQSHYIYGNNADTTLGYYNPSQKPDSTVSTTAYPWPDYYVLPTPQYPATSASSPMTAVSAPMVVADGQMNSIGQLGDVFDPARLPGTTGAIALSRGGGRTFKIGQHDDLYSYDPTGSANTSNNPPNDIPASNGWAAWRLADVFDVADPIEMPARININGVRRDNGAALLSLLQGFTFQPTTTTDPVIHGDGHTVSGSTPLATQPLDTTTAASSGTPVGFAALIAEITTRLNATDPTSGGGTVGSPSGPFFERGELGEIGVPGNTATPPLFGANPASAYAAGNTMLVHPVDMNKTFDHSREELVRRIAQMVCTRGDTFTIYAVGQSISQPTTTAPLKITGTQRMRVTCRLVPKALGPLPGSYVDFHPGYKQDSTTGAITPRTDYASYADTSASGRFARPDHYDVQILSTNAY